MDGTRAFAIFLVVLLLVGFRLRRLRACRLLARSALFLLPFPLASVGLEFVLRAASNVDVYRIAPESDSASEELFIKGTLPKWTYVPGFRGHFTHPEYRSESFDVNPQGFRDPPWPERPDPTEWRALVLGDSCTVGYGVEHDDAFPALLQARLASASARPVRVLNAGVAGYGPAEEMMTYLAWKDRVAPQCVIVAFYDGNDLEDVRLSLVMTRNARMHSFLLPTEEAKSTGKFKDEGLPRVADPAARAAGPAPWKRWVGVRTAQFLDQRIRQLRVRFFGEAPDAVYNNVLLRSMLRDHADPEVEEDMALALLVFRTLRDKCEEAGAKLVVLRLPARVQASPREWRKLQETLGLDPSKFDRTLPGRELVEKLRAEGIVAVDALDVMEEKPGAASAYFLEGHPNADGHARLALLLETVLRNAGLAP